MRGAGEVDRCAGAGRLWAAAVLGLLMAACLQPVDLELPAMPDSSAAVLVYGLEGPAPQAYVLNLDAPTPKIVWPAAGEVLLLPLPASFEALQLVPGPLVLIEPEAEGRALPLTGRTWRGQTQDARVDWSDGPAIVPEEQVRLRVSAFDPRICAEAGGCTLQADPLICTLPCPAPSTPASPMPPQLTQLAHWRPVLVQGEPWIAADGQPVLAPAEPERLICPQGQMRRPDEPQCRDISTCPAPGQWPPSIIDAVYVRQGASNGDGSADRPFGELTEALLTAAAERPIVFEGRFELGLLINQRPEILRQRSLHGVCPERATLTTSFGQVALRTEKFSLYDLSLELDGALDLGDTSRTQIKLQRIEVRQGSIGLVRGHTEVTDSSFVAPHSLALVASSGAQLEISGCYVHTYYGLHLYGGAGLRVRNSIFEGRTIENDVGHGLTCSNCAHVDFEGSVLRRFSGAAIAASNTPKVRFVDSQILDVHLRGIDTRHCNGGDCLEPAENGFTVTTTITRSQIRSGGASVVFESGRVHIEDAVLRSDSNAVELRPGTVPATEVILTRVAIRDVGQQAIRLLGNPGSHRVLRITDVLVKGGDEIVHQSVRTMLRAQFFDFTVNRLHIDGSFGDGLTMRCGGGTLNDVMVQDIQDVGIRLYPSRPVSLTRVEGRRVHQTGMLLYADEPGGANDLESCVQLDSESTPEISIADLRLHTNIDGPRGISVCSGAEVDVVRAEIEGFEEGIHLQENLLTLREALLKGAEVGVSSPAGAQVGGRLLGLRFEDTGRPMHVRLPNDSACPY